MYKKIKAWFEKKYLIKIESVTDSSYFKEISDLIGYSFRTAMERDHFIFSHHTDFMENLEALLNEGGQIFIVKYGCKIVGTISLAHKELNTWYYKGEAVKLLHFAILPKYQHHGLGNQLISIVLNHAQEHNLPVFLYTPEKNTNVINYYEKYGFLKIRMLLSEEHYSVLLFKPLEHDEAFLEEQPQRYIKSVILCLMKHWTICSTQTDSAIQALWEKDFLPYLESENEDIRTDMRNVYRKFKISPKQYKKLHFESMTKKERKNFT